MMYAFVLLLDNLLRKNRFTKRLQKTAFLFTIPANDVFNMIAKSTGISHNALSHNGCNHDQEKQIL